MKPLELSRLARRQVGDCLAIFAMFMVLFGPLIGQGSAWAQRSQAAEPHCMTMQAEEHGDHPGEHAHQLMDVCGYCSLFFHTPGIPQTHAGMHLRAVASTFISPFSLRLATPTAPIFPGAMSHAPPATAQL